MYSISLENSEIRAEGRAKLNGNWGTAVVATLVVFLISGIGGWISGSIQNVKLFSLLSGMQVSEWSQFAAYYRAPAGTQFFTWIISVGFTIFVTNILNYGYTISFLNLSRKGKMNIEDIFSGFRQYSKVFLLMLYKSIFITLWTLLFIIPGIVKTYSYAMTEYIRADDPSIEPLDAITKSREMMNGWKGKLFLLDLSLIGWAILSLFTCNIGMLWLAPYYNANRTEFYRALSGIGEEAFTMPNDDDLVIEAAQKEIERINKDNNLV